MNARHTLVLVVGCAFLAVAAFGEQSRAVPRSSSGGSSSSGAGTRHAAPSVHSSGTSRSAPSTAHPSPSRGMSPAERRHPQAGTGRGGGGYYPSHPVYPGYPGWGWGGYPPAYWGYWWPYGYSDWGWGSYWGSAWGAGAVYTYAQPDRGALRVLVDPSDTRVYVDGYYAGVADDFDGLFQRLHLAPGRHEISLKLTGHRTHRIRVYVGSGATLKLDHEMEEGTGETFEDLTGEAPVREARSPRESPGWSETPEAAPGELRLQVQPQDASVYVDGEFRGTGREAATLALPPGPHRVEVVRPGYQTAERDVEVGSEGVAALDIELTRP